MVATEEMSEADKSVVRLERRIKLDQHSSKNYPQIKACGMIAFPNLSQKRRKQPIVKSAKSARATLL